MSCLCDRDIERTQGAFGLIEPFNRELLQPASYELTFDGSKILVARERDVRLGLSIYDVRDREFKGNNPWGESEHEDGCYILYPKQFYIASSREIIKIPRVLMARFEGKSTLGRAGLMVHITAGYIDPGFHGTLTLEMMNLAPWPILLRDGDKIGQLSFHEMSDVPGNSYGECNNHYQGQSGPTPPL